VSAYNLIKVSFISLSCSLLCITEILANSLDGNILNHRDSIKVEILKDINGTLDINDVTKAEYLNKFELFSDKSFNFGVTTETLWLRITIPNEIKNYIDHIEVTNPFIDLVKIFTPLDNDEYMIQQAGDSIPFNERPYALRTFVFDLEANDNADKAKPIYLQIKSGGALSFAINLWQKKENIKHAVNSHTLLGFYFGMIIIMALYNLLIFFTIHERSYLLYVLYISCLALFTASLSGFGYQYLWSSPHWAQISTVSFMGMVIFTAFMFTREFLNTSQNTPILDRLILFMMGLTLIQICISLSGEVSLAIKMGIPLGIAFSPIVWFAGILSWKSGYRPARFFITAWTLFLITVMISGLTHAGFLSVNLMTTYAMQFGSALEVILLSLALADRITVLKIEKEEMQKIHLKQLEEYNLSLEKMVDERTMELNRTAEIARDKAEMLKEANEELKIIATRDGLTGLLNHQTFIEQLSHMVDNAKRYEYYLSILIIDADNFKNINDTYGHQAGNEVLKLISNVIKINVRESDIAARYGGEEFAVVLSRAAQTEAVEKAEKIRSKIQDITFSEFNNINCTVSIGVATLDWHEKESNYNKTLKNADLAMYKAKETGKNKVCTPDIEYRVIRNN
jgi:diguanylate cyclase (GGDEF)-like protein